MRACVHIIYIYIYIYVCAYFLKAEKTSIITFNYGFKPVSNNKHFNNGVLITGSTGLSRHTSKLYFYKRFSFIYDIA